MFNKDNLIKHAKKAEIPDSFIKVICDYLEVADIDKLKECYDLLFNAVEPIFPIIKVEKLLSEYSDKNNPGLFETVLFLVAADAFEKFLIKNNLDSNENNFLDSYYKNVRRFMQMNYVRDNTYALIRHGYFLYGYARPFILRIGRFSFELRQFYNSRFDIYENEQQRLFIGGKGLKINEKGYFDDNGKPALYKIDGGNLICNKFLPDGRLDDKPFTLDLNKWNKVFCDGDYYLTVHIPGDGKLDKDSIESSFELAIPMLKKVFSKYSPKHILCSSWLISPQLKPHLKESSNILLFQSYFDSVCTDVDTNAIFEHIFKCPVCPVENLKAINSLQFAVLDLYKSGVGLRYGTGILKKEFNNL